MEKNTGFWTAFLLCLLIFCVGIAVIVGGKRYYVVRPPRGGIIVSAFRACWIGLANKGRMGEFDRYVLFLSQSMSDVPRRCCQTFVPGGAWPKAQNSLERPFHRRAQACPHCMQSLCILSDLLARIWPNDHEFDLSRYHVLPLNAAKVLLKLFQPPPWSYMAYPMISCKTLTL